jgi:hypothetical protein
MFPEEWNELRVRKKGAGDAKEKIQALAFHR